MSELMSGVDAAWLHMDRPVNTADIVGVMTFAEPMPASALRDVVEERLLPHARFRQRVVPQGPLALSAWEDDPSFSLRHHLGRRKLARGGARALQSFTSTVATHRLDPHHPLWHAWLVDGVGQGSALVMKLHHCMADGFALMGVLLSLADDLALVTGAPPAATAAAVMPELRRAPTYQDLRLAEPVVALRRALLDPARALDLAGRGATFARSLGRMALLPPDPPTRLHRKLSGRRRIAFSPGIPLAAVRDRAHALGATVNDLLVAALAGALRAELAAHGESVATDLRALVPVNLRDHVPTARDEVMGNCFGLVFLDLPVHGETPAERLALVRARTAALKRSPDAVVSYGVLAAIGHLPGPVELFVTEFFTRKASLVVTNVPGPRERLHVAGHEIEDIMFNVPHAGVLGLGVSILSYAGQVRVGVRADVAVLPDPGALARRFAAEVEAFGAAA